MKKIILSAAVIWTLASCSSEPKAKAPVVLPAGVHAGLVEEVLQTTQYTYLHVKDGAEEKWLATTKLPAAKGETYYFRDGLTMSNFESKELQRKFEAVVFLDNISNNPETLPASGPQAMQQPTGQGATAQSGAEPAVVGQNGGQMANGGGNTNQTENTGTANQNVTPAGHQPISQGSAVSTEREKITVKHGSGEMEIGKLLEGKAGFNGKTVKLKGKVTKYNGGIMQKNWIHLQDGTAAGDKFDITITSTQEVKVGDMITVEGQIALNKDFGYGYFYDVIMENAKIIH